MEYREWYAITAARKRVSRERIWYRRHRRAMLTLALYWAIAVTVFTLLWTGSPFTSVGVLWLLLLLFAANKMK